MNSEIDLSGLKDLHYPITPDFWPLAWGWYVILGFILLTFLFIFYKRRSSSLAYAIKELNTIPTLPPEKQLKTLSQLLKRVAMVRYGREEIAPLKEEAWQEFLLASTPETLTKEQAHLLAYAIYNPTPVIPDKKMFTSCQKWITIVLTEKGK